MARDLVAAVAHAARHLGVLPAGLQARADHEEGGLGVVLRQDVEVLGRVGEVGAVVEGEGHEQAAVVGVHARVGDDEVLGLLGHAAVDGDARDGARLDGGDAVAAPLLHVADGREEQGAVGDLDARGRLGGDGGDVLGDVGAVDELEHVALGEAVGVHVHGHAAHAERVGVAAALLEHSGNLPVLADGDEVARRGGGAAAVHDVLGAEAHGQLVDLAVDGAGHRAVRVPHRTAHAEQSRPRGGADAHLEQRPARDALGALVHEVAGVMRRGAHRGDARGVVGPATGGVGMALAGRVLRGAALLAGVCVTATRGALRAVGAARGGGIGVPATVAVAVLAGCVVGTAMLLSLVVGTAALRGSRSVGIRPAPIRVLVSRSLLAGRAGCLAVAVRAAPRCAVSAVGALRVIGTAAIIATTLGHLSTLQSA